MDTDLVTRAQRGDQEAFADLVYAIADRFLAVSNRILTDIDLAQDATQQALFGIWQDLPQLRDTSAALCGRSSVRMACSHGTDEGRWTVALDDGDQIGLRPRLGRPALALVRLRLRNRCPCERRGHHPASSSEQMTDSLAVSLAVKHHDAPPARRLGGARSCSE
jgi:hypothetical protein